MNDKLLTLATEAEAQELAEALFKAFVQRNAEQGFAAVDCYPDGRPALEQTTTAITGPLPAVVDDAGNVITPSNPRALVIDARCEALQGRKVDVRGKQVTIDVSAAVPIAVASAPLSLAKRSAVVGSSAAAGGAALAGGAAALGLGSTMTLAGGVLGALVGGAIAVFKTK